MVARKKRFFLHELSDKCFSSLYLARCAEAFARANGYEPAESREDADVVIVIGCNVMQENRAVGRQYAGFAARSPRKTVVLAGCTPAMRGAANLRLLPYGRLARDPGLFQDLLRAAVPFKFLPASEVLAGKVPFLLTLMVQPSELCVIVASQGCLSRCAFCAIRQAKGGVHSTPLAQIVGQFDAAVRRGKSDFLLQSDDLGCWGADLGLDASDLLADLAGRDASARFFFQSNPEHLLRLFPKLERLMPRVRFLYIPIQSGNGRVLRAMARPYDIKKVLALIARIRRAHPGIYIVTDVIVGFPTETREEFMDTLRAARHFDAVNFCPMSVFEGTPAARLAGPVPIDEIRRRLTLARTLGIRLKTHRLYDMSGVRFPDAGGAMAKDRPMHVLWVAEGRGGRG